MSPLLTIPGTKLYFKYSSNSVLLLLHPFALHLHLLALVGRGYVYPQSSLCKEVKIYASAATMVYCTLYVCVILTCADAMNPLPLAP